MTEGGARYLSTHRPEAQRYAVSSMIQSVYYSTTTDTRRSQHRGDAGKAQMCSRLADARLSSDSQTADCPTLALDSLSLLSKVLHQVAEDLNIEDRPGTVGLPSPTSQADAVQSLSGVPAEAIEVAVHEVTVRLRRYLMDGYGSVSPMSVPSEASKGNVAGQGQVAGKSSGVDNLGSKHSSTSKARGARARSKARAELTSAADLVRPIGHTLKLCLLGSPQIYIDGVRVAQLERSNRRTQVIQLLALHRGSLSCDGLAEALSMTSHQYEDESLRPHYVRNLVWGVREWVRKKAGWGGIIQSPTKGGMGPHHYRLPDNTICDMWEFQDKLDQADRLLARAAATKARSMAGRDLDGVTGITGVTGGADDTDRAAAVREEALQLYRGEFCEGSNAGPIVQAARILEERYLLSALQQGDYWRARARRAKAIKWQDAQEARESDGTQVVPLNLAPGSAHPEEGMAWREALRNYERVLQIDNYHEEAYSRAMECYAYLGNARGVGQMFTRCQDVLHADLMQPPGEAVVRAYEECKALLGASLAK